LRPQLGLAANPFLIGVLLLPSGRPWPLTLPYSDIGNGCMQTRYRRLTSGCGLFLNSNIVNLAKVVKF